MFLTNFFTWLGIEAIIKFFKHIRLVIQISEINCLKVSHKFLHNYFWFEIIK